MDTTGCLGSGVEAVLLWVDRSAGHGHNKPLAHRVRDTADQNIFVR